MYRVSTGRNLGYGGYALYKGSKPGALIERKDLSPAVVKQFVRHGVSVMPFFRKTGIGDASSMPWPRFSRDRSNRWIWT
jgi:hypothetical protein